MSMGRNDGLGRKRLSSKTLTSSSSTIFFQNRFVLTIQIPILFFSKYIQRLFQGDLKSKTGLFCSVPNGFYTARFIELNCLILSFSFALLCFFIVFLRQNEKKTWLFDCFCNFFLVIRGSTDTPSAITRERLLIVFALLFIPSIVNSDTRWITLGANGEHRLSTRQASPTSASHTHDSKTKHRHTCSIRVKRHRVPS